MKPSLKNPARTLSLFAVLGASTIGGACASPSNIAGSVPSASSSSPIPSVANVLSDAQLARLAACESSGNPAAVSSNGKYHGLYQFDQSTWNATARTFLPSQVGVKPSKAPKAIQDAMARALYSQRGRAPWPVCGKRL